MESVEWPPKEHFPFGGGMTRKEGGFGGLDIDMVDDTNQRQVGTSHFKYLKSLLRILELEKILLIIAAIVGFTPE